VQPNPSVERTLASTVDVRTIQPSEIEQARVLLASTGWSHRVCDPAQFRDLVSRSQVALFRIPFQGGALAIVFYAVAVVLRQT
jgi:hypothetical protein